MATLGMVHDLVQDYPPRFGSHLSENETRTAKAFCDMLQEKQVDLHMDTACFFGLKVIAEAVIVHGTYLVNFSESEGVLMMRLLGACRQKMQHSDRRGLDTVLQKSKPVMLGIGLIGMTDLYRVSLPGVAEKHAKLLVDAGYPSLLGFSVSDSMTSKMFYWASHSLRFGGECASYLIDPGVLSSGHQIPAGASAYPSDFHAIFAAIRGAFIAHNSAEIHRILSQPLTKVPNAPSTVSIDLFSEHIYTHLRDDCSFILGKDPSAIGDSLRSLYRTAMPASLCVSHALCQGIVDRYKLIVSCIEALPESEKLQAKEAFVTMVLYGAVFQEGYRNSGGRIPSPVVLV